MLDRHFRQRPHHREGNDCSCCEAEKNCWTGELHANGAAEEKSCADGAAEPDHRDLALREAFMQTSFAFGDVQRFALLRDCCRWQLVLRFGAHGAAS